MPRTPKTRGRPRNYDTPKDKAKHDVVAKRARRRLRKQAAHGNTRFQIYISAETEGLPTTPSQGIEYIYFHLLQIANNRSRLSGPLLSSLVYAVRGSEDVHTVDGLSAE
ncbi:hypothetical protein BKA60DRAFT_584965 [Fusarium oxysporum]|nr:hypothetical protein BKA60DRAFT_584965 [Fusarium oxysporum]